MIISIEIKINALHLLFKLSNFQVLHYIRTSILNETMDETKNTLTIITKLHNNETARIYREKFKKSFGIPFISVICSVFNQRSSSF